MKKSELTLLEKILSKICRENGINPDNVYINRRFGYVETVNIHEKDADFCSTIYEGKTYKVKYMDGCFNPYIIEQ